MQITVTIPDGLAAEAQSRGMTVESYVEGLIAQQLSMLQRQPLPHELSAEQFEAALDELTRYSQKIPSVLDSALSSRALLLEGLSRRSGATTGGVTQIHTRTFVTSRQIGLN